MSSAEVSREASPAAEQPQQKPSKSASPPPPQPADNDEKTETSEPEEEEHEQPTESTTTTVTEVTEEIPELAWNEPPPTPPGEKSSWKPPGVAQAPVKHERKHSDNSDDQSPADPGPANDTHDDDSTEELMGDEDSGGGGLGGRWASGGSGSGRRGRRVARTDVTQQWGLFQPSVSERPGRGRGQPPLLNNANSPRRNAAGSHAYTLQQMAKRQENSLRNQLSEQQQPQQAPRHSKQHNMSPGVLGGYAQPPAMPYNNGNGSQQHNGRGQPNSYAYQPNGYANGSSHGQQQPMQPRFRHNRDSPDNAPLSSTNLYIKGLKKETTDQDLTNLCKQYGTIRTTKAITDKASNLCKGYGFVDFTTQDAAEKAVQGLASIGLQAQMAKMRPNFSQPAQQQDQTNLYVANLPPDFNENDLSALFSKFGLVISTRVLRRDDKTSRCVGFARMESCEVCEEIIRAFNDKPIKEGEQNITVKFADSVKKPKRNPMQQSFNVEQFGQYGAGNAGLVDACNGSAGGAVLQAGAVPNAVNVPPSCAPAMLQQWPNNNQRPPLQTATQPGAANAYMLSAMPYVIPSTAMPPLHNNAHIISYPALDPSSMHQQMTAQLQSMQLDGGPSVSLAAPLHYIQPQMPYATAQPIYAPHYMPHQHIHAQYMPMDMSAAQQMAAAAQVQQQQQQGTNGAGTPPQHAVQFEQQQPDQQQQPHFHHQPPPPQYMQHAK